MKNRERDDLLKEANEYVLKAQKNFQAMDTELMLRIMFLQLSVLIDIRDELRTGSQPPAFAHKGKGR